MAFNICLVHNVEAELVTHIIENLGIGIVACSDSVDVCLLHQMQVLIISLKRHCPAVVGIKIVAVNTLDDNPLAVHIKNAVFDFNSLEADFYALDGKHLSARAKSNDELVEIGFFRRPCTDIFFNKTVVINILSVFNAKLFNCNLTGLIVNDKSRFECAVLCIGIVIVKSYFKIENAVFICIVESCIGEEISDAELFFRVNINLSVNAAEEPHILILEVCAVGVTENFNGYLIFANLYIIGDSELGGSHRAL